MGPGADKLIETFLKAQVEVLKIDDTAFAGLLYGYSAEDIAKCRAHFRTHPPTVKLGFARTSDVWPVWAIILSAKRPHQEFTARSGGVVQDGGGNKYNARTTVRAPSIAVWVYSENPDLTRWHSDIIEGLLDSHIRELLADCEDVGFAGASDLSPEQAYAPENLWVRAQNWDFLKSQTVLRPVVELTPPAYGGVEGEDLGDGQTGRITPYSD